MKDSAKGKKSASEKKKISLKNWPDTIAWTTFKGHSFANLETCNEIIESFLSSRHLDPFEYHVLVKPEVENVAIDHGDND